MGERDLREYTPGGESAPGEEADVSCVDVIFKSASDTVGYT